MVLGIDIGSCYTKGVLYDGAIKEKAVVKTSFKPKQAIEEIKRRLTGFNRIGATGFGRELMNNADSSITEITAFARGAYHINPSIRTIIDIGAQDSKVIKIRDGKVSRFVMNDRCAAGTGNFVEKIAQSLKLTLEKFGSMTLKSSRPETIDSLCVVMAETEILSLVGQGKNLEDVVAGVCDSLIRRIKGFSSQIGIEEPILFSGGGALNPGLVRSMARIIGDVVVPDEPQFTGALGAALSI